MGLDLGGVIGGGAGFMLGGPLGAAAGYGIGSSLFGGDPPAPDIEGNYQANLRAARETARLNNPNIINQYGSTTYTEGPDGRPVRTDTLSPEQLALYQQNTRNQQRTSNLAGQGLANMEGTFGTALDFSGAPAMPGDNEAVRQRVIDAMMRRGDQKLGYQNEQQNADLIAQGIRPGTEAYRRAQEQQGQNRNDMLSQAELAGQGAAESAFGMDTANRKNYISEMLTKRQQPLNEINSLMSGSQQSNPFAGNNYQGGATVGSTGGMLDQYNTNVYNQRQAQNNALIGGAASLGASYLGRK